MAFGLTKSMFNCSAMQGLKRKWNLFRTFMDCSHFAAHSRRAGSASDGGLTTKGNLLIQNVFKWSSAGTRLSRTQAECTYFIIGQVMKCAQRVQGLVRITVAKQKRHFGTGASFSLPISHTPVPLQSHDKPNLDGNENEIFIEDYCHA